MRFISALFALVVFGFSPAIAQRSGASTPDPFYMGEYYGCGGPWLCNTGFTDVSGKTARNQTVNTGIKNLVLIIAGQSNRAAEAPSAYTPTNGTALDNFNPYSNQVFAQADPPLGATNPLTSLPGGGVGFIGGRIADKFVSGGQFDRVVLVPIAIGSSSVAQWATNGILQNRLCAAYKRVVAAGFGPKTNVTVAIEWGQGETDTVLATSQGNYTTSLNSVISNVKACGFGGRFFVAVETWDAGAVSSGVQAAQAAVVDSVTVFASGNIDTLNAANRIADNTHLNDAGIAAAATLVYNAMHASGAPF